jgi:hypothetical protein
MDLKNLATICHIYKIHEYEILYYNLLVLCIWNFGILHDWCLRNLKCIKWMKYEFIVLWTFQGPKN